MISNALGRVWRQIYVTIVFPAPTVRRLRRSGDGRTQGDRRASARAPKKKEAPATLAASASRGIAPRVRGMRYLRRAERVAAVLLAADEDLIELAGTLGLVVQVLGHRAGGIGRGVVRSVGLLREARAAPCGGRGRAGGARTERAAVTDADVGRRAVRRELAVEQVQAELVERRARTFAGRGAARENPRTRCRCRRGSRYRGSRR